MDKSTAYNEYVISKTMIQLEDASLEGVTIFKKEEVIKMPLYNDLSFSFKVGEIQDNRITAFFKTVIDCKTPGNDGNSISIECIYRGAFVTNEEIPASDFTEFVEVQTVPQLVPYARSLIASLSAQMNIDPIILPTMDIIQSLIKNARNEESEESNEGRD